MALIDDLYSQYGLQQGGLDGMLGMDPPADPANIQPVVGGQLAGMGIGGNMGPLPMGSSEETIQPWEIASSGGFGKGAPDVLALAGKIIEESAGAGGGSTAPKGMQLTGQTQKSEIGGPTTEQRVNDVAQAGQFELDKGQIDADRKAQQAQELEQQATRLRAEAMAEKEAREREVAETEARQNRLRGQQRELAQQNDEPINPRRYFENMSFFSKAAAVLSAGIYGFLGGKGNAPVAEMLIGMAQEDTRAQIANQSAAQGKRSALIAQYEREYGDTELAAKRLEADKLLTLAKQAKAEEAEAKSADLKAQAQDIRKTLEARVGDIHRELQKATWSKPVEVTSTFQQPKPQGGADPGKKLKEALELDKLLEQQGYTPEQRAQRLKALGMEPPAGKTKAELDRETETAKLRELSPEEKKDLRERVDGLAAARASMRDIEQAAGIERGPDGIAYYREDAPMLESGPSVRSAITSTLDDIGGDIPAVGGSLRNLARRNEPETTKTLRRGVSAVITGMAKAEGQGALSDTDRKAYESRLPVDDMTGFRKGTDETFRKQKQAYRNLAARYGKEYVDQILRERGDDPSVYQ